MAEVTGLVRLVEQLRQMASKKIGDVPNPSVAVGYTAEYALWVHENMEIWPPGMRLKGLPRGQGFSRDQATSVVYVPNSLLRGRGSVGGKARGFYWDPQGKAGPKFLEGPAREMQQTLGDITMQAVKQGKTLAQGLILAGLRLQRESQLRVPVNYGVLKASAFTRLENGMVDSQTSTAA